MWPPGTVSRSRSTPPLLLVCSRPPGFGLIRYPGGSWADEYDWSETPIRPTAPVPSPQPAREADPLDFGELSAQARSAGASTFVTVNYGSGTPSEAAAWVTPCLDHQRPRGRSVGGGQRDVQLSREQRPPGRRPDLHQGIHTGRSVCPSTASMAASYAANVVPYSNAMKKADPAARIGVPWAFSGSQAAGAAVKNPSLWNAKVLRAVKTDVGFVDAHWYPFDQVPE